jgi:uncharacterized membrane protein
MCKRPTPLEALISGEIIRPGIVDILRKRESDWSPSCMLCSECLNLLRSEYVEDALAEEKGELSRLDREVLASLKEQETVAENLNLAFDKALPLGQYVADKVASFGGSWTFIVSFFGVLLIWMTLNSLVVLNQPFDPYPYILLNLVLSCLAAIQAPIIMMSQNRLEARDRLRSEHDYQVNLKAELEIRHLHEKLDVLLKHQWQKLLEIQQIQLDLMKEIGGRDQSHSG